MHSTSAPVSAETTEGRTQTLLRLATVAAQLIVVALVIRFLELENRALYLVLLLAAVTVPVHALLPPRLRVPAFAAISLAGLTIGLGPGSAGWVMIIAAGMVALCHLPLRLSFLVATVMAAGFVVAAVREFGLPGPLSIPDAVWPVVGSMLMFRLALYLYAVRVQGAPSDAAHSIAYFAMLPNVAFPLFPVVDYKTFTTSKAAPNATDHFDRGMQWIVRGVFHLVLYRLVYFWVVVDPISIRNPVELLQFMVATFLLYLRVSGQFHLIVGLLYLFGFKLPETHHKYYFARSFTDLWRRINIYWTDFMTKLVYMPAFFRLRRFGQTRAILLSTALVFFVTWVLHAYQWFWLLGNIEFPWPDVLFWSILAVFVMATTARQLRRPRTAPSKGWSATKALTTLGTFLTMSVLWSLWSSQTVEEWTAVFAAPLEAPSALEWVGLAAIVAVFLALAGLPWADRKLADASREQKPFGRELAVAGWRTAALVALIAFETWGASPSLPAPIRELAVSVGDNSVNARDEEIQQRGYYEQLNLARQPASRTWKEDDYEQPYSVLARADFFEPREGFVTGMLEPDAIARHGDDVYTTNRWGMRDRDYEREKPAGTHRIAVFGASFVMGLGVSDGEPFEAVLEERLRSSPGLPTEVLNFGVPNHSLIQSMAYLEEDGFAFDPDVVLMTVDPMVRFRIYRAIAYLTSVGAEAPWPEVAAIARDAGVDRTTGRMTAIRRLHSQGDRLLAAVFRQLAEMCRVRGVEPILVVVRLPTSRHKLQAADLRIAQEAGLTVIDLTNAYEGYDETTLRLGETDHHHNALGHRVLGERLFEEIEELRWGGGELARHGTEQNRSD
jgi:D-alanyl-lipoteichoic acid acyltransferase DltB (MBOAT superfamily)